jgi:hypothetical protein
MRMKSILWDGSFGLGKLILVMTIAGLIEVSLSFQNTRDDH